MSPPALILASTSPYRRALLERLGVPFRAVAPRVDEERLKDPALDPRTLALKLARAKAESIAETERDAVVIGSDQLVVVAGRIFGKPGNAEAAAGQLLAMSGGPHELITAVAVVHPGGCHEHCDVTTLWMRSLGRAEVERYLDVDKPFDCAGSYKMESHGITLFERIESEDQSAITGLPLIAMTTTLRGLGYAIP